MRLFKTREGLWAGLSKHYAVDMDFIYFLLIGLLAGWIAGQLTKGSGFGLVGNLIVGVIGALLGGFVVRLLGFATEGRLLPSLITAVVGAILLLFLLGVIAKKKG